MEKFLFDSKLSFIKNQAGNYRKWYLLRKINIKNTHVFWLTKEPCFDEYGIYYPKTPILIFLN
jgi:hypothetical protein